ncbi:Bax inhibitor-1/YccA family protein [Lacticaseibacillus pantheris]|nr:Bax inhibitor-1/YccA family protein [Lacticaseibacillus pantheris]WKF84215.1 Bax inhibitor-1/YccA family protein [Lacticaseibacillus pantheris]
MQERRAVNESGLSQFFGRVYGVMGGGMVVTAAVTYLLGYVFRQQYFNFIASNTIVFYVMTFMPIIFVILGSTGRSMAHAGRALVFFLLLAASEGFTLAVIMSLYSGTTVIAALLTTAVVFGTMAMVGIFGKKDLSRAGSIAYMSLFGIILMSLVNMFLRSSGMAMLINYAILAIFIVLVAYDNQTLKRLYAQADAQGMSSINALAVSGAVSLYLDFLNLFIAILQIFGMGSDRN